MTRASKQLGNLGENLTKQYLLKKKFKVLQQNLVTKLGEVDILAKDKNTLVVVEVKTKTSSIFGSPIEMITPAKQKKLILLTLELSCKYKTSNVRIDVAAVDASQNPPQIKYFKGIIEANV